MFVPEILNMGDVHLHCAKILFRVFDLGYCTFYALAIWVTVNTSLIYRQGKATGVCYYIHISNEGFMHYDAIIISLSVWLWVNCSC